jgi:RNA polymerase sigma-54 factor
MHPTVRLDQRQQQTLSPRLQHAVKLLQMSSLDFVQELHEVIGRNPFLEQDESEPDETDVADVSRLSGVAAAQIGEHEMPTLEEVSPINESPIDERDDIIESVASGPDQDADYERDNERDTWLADGSVPSRRGEDGQLGALDLVPLRPGLRPHLHSQLNVLPLPERDLVLAKSVVESLDDDGYLRTPLAELLEDTELDPPPNEDELHIALKRVQSLEPAGVGARTVAECLLLQLPAIECEAIRTSARKIVSEHLDWLAAKDVTRIAQWLDATPAHVEAVCERIRRLDPRPGWRFDATQTQYVTPDIVVKKVRGQWTAMLNPSVVPRVRINHIYAELFQRHRQAQNGGGQNTEMAAHLQEARWTLRNVEQRFVTILSVAQAIIKRQKRFFELGPMAMKPLGLKEIANETGMHESTVSRVTNNKYMATPLGVFELKYFFSRAMTSTSGAAYSGTAIRGLIKDMIEAEKPTDPLSDAEIARQLAQQGLVVARRTVTKYRQLLRIEAVDRRRKPA